MKIVWILWDDRDYYGPDFMSVHATEEKALEALAEVSDNKLEHKSSLGGPRSSSRGLFTIEPHELT